MARIRSMPLLIAICAVTLAAGLAGSDAEPARDTPAADRAEEATFREAFQERERIRLRGSTAQPIGEVTGLSLADDGRIAAADRQSDRVFVFTGQGKLVRVLGRAGEGPGEFEGPTDVAFSEDGRLFVSEAGSPRITRYDANLVLDSVLHLDDALYAIQLAGLGENVLAYVNSPRSDAPRLRLLQDDGTELKRFHPSHPAYTETPYWSATTDRILAASDRWIIAGGNLIYPLVRYTRTGELVDSVGHEPSEWRQAPRPKRGAFQGPDQLRRFEEWRRSFTTIQNVAFVEDRFLVVSHERLDPDVLAYEDAEYFADVYDLEERRKIWTGIDLPGRVLAGGPLLTLLTEGPPGGWVIEQFEVAR